MEVLDSYFVGRSGWAEQVLLSVQVLQQGNSRYQHPKLFNAAAIAQSVDWEYSDGEIRIKADFNLMPAFLVRRPTLSQRVRAYTPIHALDVGVDRDLSVPFSGLPIPADLMAEAELVTMEERLHYLLSAKLIHDELVAEWNAFADLQENLWLKIYRDEGQIQSEYSTYGAFYEFTQRAGFAGLVGGTTVYRETPGNIRDVGRADYESAITQWLLDSGTTARSGGAAVSNDTYIDWLAERLSMVSVDTNLLITKPIDPRDVYRYAPIVQFSASTDGDSGGASGAADSSFDDPAGGEKPGLNLLEELANKEQPLTAELGLGASVEPINTLPEC